MDGLWLTLMGVAYLVANRPFLGLACHQDAGWHAYWAFFRGQGVTLDRQLNVLMGCARLGSKFLFVLWFSMFGRGNPDRLSRLVALGLNFAVALIAYGLLQPRLGSAPALAAAGLSLAAASIPTTGIHYETAERTARLLNILIFALCLMQMDAASPILLGGVVFAMIGGALLFKITQLFEYLPLWLTLFIVHPSWEAFFASCAGGGLAVGLFVLLLAGLRLLKAENLGILGYMAASRRGGRMAGEGEPGGVAANGIEERVAAKLASGEFGGAARLAVTLARRLGVMGLAPKLYGIAVNARTFVPSVMWGAAALTAAIIAGLAFAPPGPEKTLLEVWLAGAMTGLLLQSRFLPLHFIPLLLPGALLAGLGLPHWEWWMWVLAAAALAFDARRLLGGRDIPLDLRFWPAAVRPVIERNLYARAVAPWLAEHSCPEDFILVWGTAPQLYLLAARRCPVNWLSTSPHLMDPILSDWRDILWRRMRHTRPLWLVEVDAGLDLDEIQRQTGLRYGFAERRGPWNLYRLEDAA